MLVQRSSSARWWCAKIGPLDEHIMMMIAMMIRMMMLMMIRSATHVLTIAQRYSSARWHCAAEFFRSVVVRQDRAN